MKYKPQAETAQASVNLFGLTVKQKGRSQSPNHHDKNFQVKQFFQNQRSLSPRLKPMPAQEIEYSKHIK